MTEQATAESKRGRVRRLVIEPLEAWGMRRRPARPRGETRAEAEVRSELAHKAFLDRVCDDLGHMSDEQLAQMKGWLQVSGVGDKRNFWPDFVTISGTAHSFCPRPVEDLPELKSWFGSRKGEEMQSRPPLLVAHLRFIQKFRHPPTKMADVQRAQKKANLLEAEWQRAVQMRDRDRPFDDKFLFAIEQDFARAVQLVEAGMQRRVGAEGEQ